MNNTLKQLLQTYPASIYQDFETSQWMFTCSGCGVENISIDELIEHENSPVCTQCYEEYSHNQQDLEMDYSFEDDYETPHQWL